MAVNLTIGERLFEVAPFKLKELRKVAPFIEEMNVLAKRIDKDIKAQIDTDESPQQNLEDLFALSRALCEIVAIGLQKIDPAMDADAIEETVDLSFLSSLQTAARALLEQSGLASAPGEVSAPSPSATTGQKEDQAEASSISSEPLSVS